VCPVKAKGALRKSADLPLGEYLSCIAPADIMIIDLGVKNQVVAL